MACDTKKGNVFKILWHDDQVLWQDGMQPLHAVHHQSSTAVNLLVHGCHST